MRFHSRWVATALSVIALGASMLVHAAPVSGQGTWETTLQGRDLDGDPSTFEAYYDTILDISWLADANYAGIRMIWPNAKTWAATLNIHGVTGWRLPTVSPIDGTTADDATIGWDGSEDYGTNASAPGTLYAGSTASEMAHMYYNTLGNLGYCDPYASTASVCVTQTGYGMTNTGPFSNIQSYWYWSGTVYAPNTSMAWDFHPPTGMQTVSNKPADLYVWAVYSGDVDLFMVPVPAAVWLFGSGLLGLIGVARRRAA
jgi:hypothetical protein